MECNTALNLSEMRVLVTAVIGLDAMQVAHTVVTIPILRDAVKKLILASGYSLADLQLLSSSSLRNISGPNRSGNVLQMPVIDNQRAPDLASRLPLLSCGICNAQFRTHKLYKRHVRSHQTSSSHINTQQASNKLHPTALNQNERISSGFNNSQMKTHPISDSQTDIFQIKQINQNKSQQSHASPVANSQQLSSHSQPSNTTMCLNAATNLSLISPSLSASPTQRLQASTISQMDQSASTNYPKLYSAMSSSASGASRDSPRGNEPFSEAQELTQCRFSCQLCGIKLRTKQSYQDHLRTHLNDPRSMPIYACQFCPHLSVTRRRLEIHERHHTGEKPFKCSLCDYAAAQASQLKSHMQRNHQWEEPNVSHSSMSDIYAIAVSTENTDTNHDHASNVVDQSSGSPGGTVSLASNAPVLNEVKSEIQDTADCNYQSDTYNEEDMDRHFMETAQDVAFRTQILGGLSAEPSGAPERSPSMTLPGTPRYKCMVCKARFRLRHQHQEHMRSHMSDPKAGKIYTCEECGFCTKRNSTLIVHQRQHTGEKPFKCKLCDYAARQVTSLVIHMRSKHNEYHSTIDLV